MIPNEILCHGTDEPLKKAIKLRAGSLSMIFEPDSAFLRCIRMGEKELVRGIYVAVRDRNWDTVLSKVSNLKVECTQDAFDISFEVECIEREIAFFWTGTVIGDPEGRVTFTMDGIARSTFLRNRIGFCVLHPLQECAGKPCSVEKVDGTVEHGAFPQYISPHQPFKDMRAIAYDVAPGISAEIRFDGDIFEMEDQRNWTDASFKTYCTPLELPFPIEVMEGTRIVQTVTLEPTVEASGEILEPREDTPEVVFTVEENSSARLPHIGLGVASHDRSLSEREQARLKKLNLSHLRVDLDLTEPSYGDALKRAASEAEELGLSLEVALFLSEAAQEELTSLLKSLKKVKPRVSRWLVFDATAKVTTNKTLRLARDLLKEYQRDAAMGAGTNAYFAEFNREHPPAEGSELVCYSINPQVHAFDDTSLVETLEAQAETVESARRIAGDLPIVVTPVTLKPRFNPNATEPELAPKPDELPSQVDPRQMSLLGAGWTLGSIKYLSESGVHSVTYYETTGWRGVMEAESGSPLPEKFRSIPGAVFPLYHVLADVGEFAGGEVIPSSSSSSLDVDGLALYKDSLTRIILANLSPQLQHVRVECSSLGHHARLKYLNTKNAEEAMHSPETFLTESGLLQQTANHQLEICLLPYAIARIDTGDTVHG
jgi:D-apionolactonase